MTPEQNPYRILQVDPTAEHDVIEAAYRRLARKYHPDVATIPDAAERMVQLNGAWEILRNPSRRAALDRLLARVERAGAVLSAAHGAAAARGSGPARRGDELGDAEGGAGDPGADGPGTTGAAIPDPVQRVSGDRTTGRSSEGSTYDPSTMGVAQETGSAGPPPGNPSGSVLTFGRYAGWSLGEIARANLEYLEWLDRMPIGRIYQVEIDLILRAYGRRAGGSQAGADARGFVRR